MLFDNDALNPTDHRINPDYTVDRVPYIICFIAEGKHSSDLTHGFYLALSWLGVPDHKVARQRKQR